MLVVYEEAIGLEAVRQRAEERFAAALGGDWIEKGRVGQLLILTVDEIEILDHLSLSQPAVRGGAP